MPWILIIIVTVNTKPSVFQIIQFRLFENAVENRWIEQIDCFSNLLSG